MVGSASGALPEVRMIRRLRRFARETLNGVERLLHPMRRRAAVRRLSRAGTPRSLLILCHGNICRSPYAARRLRQDCSLAAGPMPRIDSAGFILPGRESPEIARRVARERGVDLGEHLSQVVDSELVAGADVVLVMTSGQRRDLRNDIPAARTLPVLLLGDFDDGQPDRRVIRDPYGRSESVFHAVFERIDRCCRGLCRGLAEQADGSRPPGS